MRRAKLSAVAALVVATTVVAAAGGGPAADPTASHRSHGVAQVDADDVLMRIDLRPDGDARWTIEFRVRLEDDDEVDAFRTLQEDVASDPDNYTDRFASRMASTAADAENATGREMAIRNATVDARIQEVPSYGILTYTFEWTGFAAVDGDALHAGDALEGLYLDEQTRLVIGWPEEYVLREASPPPDEDLGGERRVGWAGPEDFAPGEPRVVVAREGGPVGGQPSLALLAAAGVTAALAVALGFAWYRRRGVMPVVGDETGDGTGDGAATDAASGGAATGADGGDAGTPPEELLSNEERVLKLVRERGGRIKQQEIVQAFGWTEAKTSQVVRSLREDGDLEGFRLGRENVLHLPGDDDDL